MKLKRNRILVYGTLMNLVGISLLGFYFLGLNPAGKALKTQRDTALASVGLSSTTCKEYLENNTWFLQKLQEEIANPSETEPKSVDVENASAESSSMPTIPKTLREFGTCLMGTEKMEMLIKEVHVITEIDFVSRIIRLTSHEDDDSIHRLFTEFNGVNDARYKLTRGFDDVASPLFLDIGANLGFVSIAFLKFHSTAQIVAFEPNAFTYIYLLWNLYLNQIPILTSDQLNKDPFAPGVYPVFGGIAGGPNNVDDVDKSLVTTTSPVQEAPVGPSQLYVPDFKTTARGNPVKFYHLSAFMKKYNLDRFDFVKMDCECCEYLVIPANKELFSDSTIIKHIAGELHPFEICKTYFDLDITAQDEVVQALDNRGCTLPSHAYDENEFVGNKGPGGHCCPPICLNE